MALGEDFIGVFTLSHLGRSWGRTKRDICGTSFHILIYKSVLVSLISNCELKSFVRPWLNSLKGFNRASRIYPSTISAGTTPVKCAALSFGPSGMVIKFHGIKIERGTTGQAGLTGFSGFLFAFFCLFRT